MKLVAVLGAGPAGLMAAQAVSLQENTGLAIFSATTEPSKLGGAQFLHKAIPIVCDEEPDTVVTYRVRGDEETYKRKVYGLGPVPFTSFAGVTDGQQQPAWNLIETYERLWEKFAPQITPGPIDARWFETDWLKDFSYIFSSVPLPAICRAQAGLVPEFHQFTSQRISVCTDPYGGPIEDNTIIYDGTDTSRFYRRSRIFGVHGTEWADAPPPGLAGVVLDTKPISTNCNCHPGIVRVGRRGTWTKGVLTHDAFVTAWKVLTGQ